MDINNLKPEFDYGSIDYKNSRTMKSEGTQRGFHRELQKAGEKCPYQSMAENGIIEYNGVIFVCDYRHNAICLGDMTNPKRVLNIPLPSGGSLKVNVDHIGDISQAAGMFTPEDLNAIMRAIHQYNHCTRKLNEIEAQEDDPFEESESEEVNQVQRSDAEEQGAVEILSEYKTELWYKLMHNDTEKKYRIGGQEMSEREWDKLLERIDETQEYLREAVKEEIEERQEEAQTRKEILEELLRNR